MIKTGEHPVFVEGLLGTDGETLAEDFRPRPDSKRGQEFSRCGARPRSALNVILKQIVLWLR